MVINIAGPVNKNQNKRWLLFKREIRNPAESDVSDVTLYWLISFIFNLIPFNLNFSRISFLISTVGGESQLVWGWKNRSEVWGAFRLSAPATFIPGDHLWTAPLRELSHQWGQPRDGRLWTLLQRRKQRGDEQPFDKPELQARVFWARRWCHCRWAEAVFWSGKRGRAESLSCPAHIAGGLLLTSLGPHLLSNRRSHATSTSFASWVERLSYLLRHKGLGSRLLRWRRWAFASDLPQDFVWMFVITFYFHFVFLQLSTCLSVFGVVCPKPKLTHDECWKECQKCTVIHFHYI